MIILKYFYFILFLFYHSCNFCVCVCGKAQWRIIQAQRKGTASLQIFHAQSSILTPNFIWWQRGTICSRHEQHSTDKRNLLLSNWPEWSLTPRLLKETQNAFCDFACHAINKQVLNILKGNEIYEHWKSNWISCWQEHGLPAYRGLVDYKISETACYQPRLVITV